MSERDKKELPNKFVESILEFRSNMLIEFSDYLKLMQKKQIAIEKDEVLSATDEVEIRYYNIKLKHYKNRV